MLSIAMINSRVRLASGIRRLPVGTYSTVDIFGSRFTKATIRYSKDTLLESSKLPKNSNYSSRTMATRDDHDDDVHADVDEPKTKKAKKDDADEDSVADGVAVAQHNSQGEPFFALSTMRRVTIRKFKGTTLVDIREVRTDTICLLLFDFESIAHSLLFLASTSSRVS